MTESPNTQLIRRLYAATLRGGKVARLIDFFDTAALAAAYG